MIRDFRTNKKVLQTLSLKRTTAQYYFTIFLRASHDFGSLDQTDEKKLFILSLALQRARPHMDVSYRVVFRIKLYVAFEEDKSTFM